MKRILFICYGGGHALSLLPLIKRFRELQTFHVTVLALTTAANLFKKEKVEYVGFKDFTHMIKADFLDAGKKLVDENDKNDVIELDESIAYHGINFIDLIQQHGESSANEIYRKSGRQSFYPINFMRKIIPLLSIDLLIGTNAPRSEKAAFHVAGELQIKSLCLVDLFAPLEIEWISKSGFASKVCVLNQRIKNKFLTAGLTDKEVVVTGNPAFDSLNELATRHYGKAIRKQRKWEGSQMITLLYASQQEPIIHPYRALSGNPDLPREIERELRKFVKKNINYRLVIRYHPSESVKFEPQERVSLSPKEEMLHGLIHAVDVVVVVSSTVGVEGYLAGKIVISVDNSIFTDDALFSQLGISLGVSEPSFLPERILSISKTREVKQHNMDKISATDAVEAMVFELLDIDKKLTP